jgi:hypothetical protein
MLRYLPLLLVPAMAQACDTEILSCTFDDGAKAVEVCVQGDQLTYDFGPLPKAELSLSVPLDEGTFNPWPGVGSAIWESVDFSNEGFTYQAWSSIPKDLKRPEVGGVLVLQGEDTVADLTCDAGTIRSDFGSLSAIMYDAGLCYSHDDQDWVFGACD